MLFTFDKTNDLNACIQYGGSSYQEERMADGYRAAADVLLYGMLDDFSDYRENAQNTDDFDRLPNRYDLQSPTKDTIIYPMVFLYRHSIELHLKSFLKKIYRKLTEKEINAVKTKHEVGCLWEAAKTHIHKFYEETGPIPEDFSLLDEVIKEISKYDKGSFSFRYSTTRDGKPNNPDMAYINIVVFGQRIVRACNLLETMVKGFDPEAYR